MKRGIHDITSIHALINISNTVPRTPGRPPRPTDLGSVLRRLLLDDALYGRERTSLEAEIETTHKPRGGDLCPAGAPQQPLSRRGQGAPTWRRRPGGRTTHYGGRHDGAPRLVALTG